MEREHKSNQSIDFWREELQRAENSGDDDAYFTVILEAQKSGLSEQEIASLMGDDDRDIGSSLHGDPAWEQLTKGE